jgi:hypothetical protein
MFEIYWRSPQTARAPQSSSPERAQGGSQAPLAFRDHRAFLNSYGSEDEGLYDDAGLVKTAWSKHVQLAF